MTTADDRSAHGVIFSNLVDSRTGKPVRLEVPDNLVYEGALLYARFEGEKAADAFRKRMSEGK